MNFNNCENLSIFMFLYKTAKHSIFKVAEYVFIIGNNLELPRGFNHAPGNRQQVKV